MWQWTMLAVTRHWGAAMLTMSKWSPPPPQTPIPRPLAPMECWLPPCELSWTTKPYRLQTGATFVKTRWEKGCLSVKVGRKRGTYWSRVRSKGQVNYEPSHNASWQKHHSKSIWRPRWITGSRQKQSNPLYKPSTCQQHSRKCSLSHLIVNV